MATIERSELVRIVDEASQGITSSTRQKLLDVAETTNAVAAGWFHCEGVGCPIRQAGRRTNQKFQTAFDFAIAQRFDIPPEDLSIEPFVIWVRND
jgi:hypothetical protein